MNAEQNDLITRIGPGTLCGKLMRHYWQPVALLDEFDPQLDAAVALRPVKAVRILGQDLVLFKDASGQFGLLDRDCPHRGGRPVVCPPRERRPRRWLALPVSSTPLDASERQELLELRRKMPQTLPRSKSSGTSHDNSNNSRCGQGPGATAS